LPVINNVSPVSAGDCPSKKGFFKKGATRFCISPEIQVTMSKTFSMPYKEKGAAAHLLREAM
jgi:hypothetical protein